MPTSMPQPGLGFVPSDVMEAMTKIHEAGFDVWLVGGAVRDNCLGRKPKDWDIATTAGPRAVMKIFPRVVPVGIRHGTVQVHTKKREIEVTSVQKSGEAGILDDLARRDFTINAMALSFPEGILLDPHGGLIDLEKGLIRGVSDPRARFAEDPLRIVRAARLSGVYGFSVHSGTVEAMRHCAEGLLTVAGERIRDEICKTLLSDHLAAAFELLRETGALRILVPEIPETSSKPASETPTEARARPDTVGEIPESAQAAPRSALGTSPGSAPDIYRHSLLCVLNSPARLPVRLAALLHKSVPPGAGPADEASGADFRRSSASAAAARLKSWNMSKRMIEDISSLIKNRLPIGAVSWTGPELRRFIANVRTELLDDFIALARAERLSAGTGGVEDIRRLHSRMHEQLKTASALRIGDLAVDGAQIMRTLGLAQGPEVGLILKRLFQMVLEDQSLNTREHLLEIAKRMAGVG